MQVNPDVGSMDAVLDKLYGKVGTNKSYICLLYTSDAADD